MLRGVTLSQYWGQHWLAVMRPEDDDGRATCDLTVRRVMIPSMESRVLGPGWGRHNTSKDSLERLHEAASKIWKIILLFYTL